MRRWMPELTTETAHKLREIIEFSVPGMQTLISALRNSVKLVFATYSAYCKYY